MCEFLSGWINIKTEAIVCRDLRNHCETQTLTPGFVVTDHREWEWTGENEDSLVVRVLEGEDKSAWKASILARWKKRTAILIYILNHWVGGSLDLGGLTTLDPKVKLPESIGGYLYLRGIILSLPRPKA